MPTNTTLPGALAQVAARPPDGGGGGGGGRRGRPPRHHRFATNSNAANTVGHYTGSAFRQERPSVSPKGHTQPKGAGSECGDIPTNWTSPCVTSLSVGPAGRSSRSPRTPAGRPRPVITKVVIYITLDICVHNVPRAPEGAALPALCTGKPITAVVVAF